MREGKYDKEGEFDPVSWDTGVRRDGGAIQARAGEKGPSGVGMFGSGQWTIWEGYAALENIQGRLSLRNNIDPNARHCMASAVAGFMRAFGVDNRWVATTTSRMLMHSCYGAPTWPKCTPILWTRVTDRRLGPSSSAWRCSPSTSIASLELADNPRSSFQPQTDLAILNYIANHIIQDERRQARFVDRHTRFVIGNTDIGYGLRPDILCRKRPHN